MSPMAGRTPCCPVAAAARAESYASGIARLDGQRNSTTARAPVADRSDSDATVLALSNSGTTTAQRPGAPTQSHTSSLHSATCTDYSLRTRLRVLHSVQCTCWVSRLSSTCTYTVPLLPACPSPRFPCTPWLLRDFDGSIGPGRLLFRAINVGRAAQQKQPG